MTAQTITGWRNRPKAAAPKSTWAADPAFNGVNAALGARAAAAPKTHISFDPSPAASRDRNFAIRQARI